MEVSLNDKKKSAELTDYMCCPTESDGPAGSV